MIKLKNLTQIYQSQSKEDVVANDNISLSFDKKGLVFIIGKSGAGKTTLLNILAGLDEKTSGEYFINNKSIDYFNSLDDFRNECVGFVFQDYNLIDYLSVSENVEIALSDIQKKKLLKKTNIKPLNSKYIAKMGFYNIKNHLGKSLISVFLLVLTIFSICVGQMFLGFNSEKAIVKTFSDIQIP